MGSRPPGPAAVCPAPPVALAELGSRGPVVRGGIPSGGCGKTNLTSDLACPPRDGQTLAWLSVVNVVGAVDVAVVQLTVVLGLVVDATTELTTGTSV